MAIRNKAAVYINGINLTCFTVMPIKWGNLLDEQLDECYLSLRHCPIKNFKPLTPVEIHFSNELYFASTSVNTQKRIKRYIVANDTGATESPIGSKRWDHDLYIIEVTKILECIVVDTLTFTNDLGRNYASNAQAVIPITIKDSGLGRDPVSPSDFKSPLSAGEPFNFVSAKTIFPYYFPASTNRYIQKVSFNGVQIWENTFIIDDRGETTGQDIGYTANLNSGTYTINYSYTESRTIDETEEVQYNFVVVQNHLPLKKWTITDVINRTLDLAEPIRLGETPRFKLNEEQAAMFDNVLAPQFSFTKQTLRECLQECGKVIHGEPRLDIKKDGNGKFYYEVLFDLYGQTEKSNIFHRKYIRNTVSQVIDSYASHLDSNAENLVNQLDKLAGVIVEPYRDGFKTVRTETMYVRITDANMIIPTQYPIDSIEKLESGYIPGYESLGKDINITPWIFESSVYNTQLSSYESQYPYSKAFGLSYTRGQKNITALNFKSEHPISDVFNRYAIVNILREATNNQNIDIGVGKENNNDYPLLAFRVTYTPFYNVRVGQTKTYYPDYPYGAALIYNQQSNVIESRYYGENLKGVIARIGNMEKSITYNLARLSDIPKAGQMYDDDYYISAVSVEYLPTYIKCTIGLSKDFNRLSQYIGISSVKRFSEISQTQAVERNLLYREYIVVGKEETPDEDSLISNNFMNAVEETFLQDYPYQPLTNISAYGGTYKQPVVSSTKVDITDKVQSSYSNTTKTFTFTVTEEIEATKTVHARIQFYVDGATEENGVDVSFTGNSATYDAEEWVAVAHTSFTIASLNVYEATYEKNEYPLPLVNLPVISSAFGNSLSFAWKYEDNYSAGAVSQYATGGINDNTVTGYFQNNYQYPDYYGRMYYYNFYLEPAGEPINNFEEQEEIGTRLPRGYERRANDSYFSTNLDKPFILRKDNREALQGNIQIDFVTNVQNLIIGSALAAYCPLVRGVDKSLAAKLYVFDEPLNKFINHVQGSLDVDLSTLPSMDIAINTGSGKFSVNAGNFPANGKAWAIVTQQSLGKEEKVEDEEGNVFTQSEVKGGDVLIAQNMEISAGQAFTPIYFTKKRKIFKEDVWTEIR